MRHFLLSFFVAAFFVVTLSPAIAQVPRLLSYQGVVLDGAGKFISDGPHNIQLKLYNALTAVSPLYTENQTGVIFVKGNFNIIIGSTTPIPDSITFNKGYFLGVSVDGGSEMLPRTPLSPAPYAIHASVADALAPGAPGVVTSVNTKSGAITLAAGQGTLISNSGSTITISSTGGGGNGIQGVQNSDPSIAVANPTGPIASLSVGLGGITTTKIADGSVTPAKIDGTSANAGMVLTANGLGGVNWATPSVSGTLTLPFTSIISNSSSAFSITNSGTGGAALFAGSDANSTAIILDGVSAGAANSIAVHGQNTGLGRGGFFEITNSANNGVALTGKTQGNGTGVSGNVTGNGGYGVTGTGSGMNTTGMLASYAGANSGGIALEMNNGYLKVTGNSKTAYVHVTTAANNDAVNTNSSILSYPGMAQTDMVIVTHVWIGNRFNNGYGVWWNQNNLAWEILLENTPAVAMPNGEKFNVLVIKQ